MEALITSDEILESLQDVPKSARGAHLMRHFFIDILGRSTREANVFKTKSQYYFGESRYVSKELKLVTVVLLVLFNMICWYQCVICGAIKGYQWQLTWMTLCLCSLIFLL